MIDFPIAMLRGQIAKLIKYMVRPYSWNYNPPYK